MIHGFSLVELIVAAAMLLIVLGSLASIFSSTNRQTAATDRRYRQESNIDADLALISKLNEHYTCAKGVDGADNKLTISCTSAMNTHPDQNGYFPDPVAAPDVVTSFESYCNESSSNQLLSPLIGLIGTLAPDNDEIVVNGRSLPNLTRTVVPDGKGHRYTVSYFDGDTPSGGVPSGELLRQASLVPTAANWCPDIP
jgi:type II secretory pathway pseudopilin PulG